MGGYPDLHNHLFGPFTRMDHIEEIAAQLKQHLGGKTLATLREDAAKEMNGVCWMAIRPDAGPRRILLFCITDGYELRKLDGLNSAKAEDFGDWDSVTLTEAIACTMLSGGFAYAFDLKSPERSRAVILIAAVPDSITRLEQAFNLPP
jgi:hypothetical protein